MILSNFLACLTVFSALPAAHGQTETRVSARAMSLFDVAGIPTVAAARSDGPLVTITRADLTDGAKISCHTIVDLGCEDPLLEAAQTPGIVEPVAYLGDTTEVQATPTPPSGVFQAAERDAWPPLTLRRKLDTGAMGLPSYHKAANLRLSAFVSEYHFSNYEYVANQLADQARVFQNMLKADDGFADPAS